MYREVAKWKLRCWRSKCQIQVENEVETKVALDYAEINRGTDKSYIT